MMTYGQTLTAEDIVYGHYPLANCPRCTHDHASMDWSVDVSGDYTYHALCQDTGEYVELAEVL